MIIVDTSALIDSLTGPKRSAPHMRALIDDGQRLMLPALVLYEWLRGPRVAEELEAQEALFPSEETIETGPAEARQAAELYRQVVRSRGREIDLLIAAHTLARGAALWTLNRADFADVPGLTLV